MLGGGGITPDVIVADSPLMPRPRVSSAALGKHVAEFRDVITDYALELKGKRIVAEPNFAVTPAMRADLYARLQRRGVSIPRTLYDADAAVVDRLLADQIARYVFGPDAEYERRLRRDPDVATALGLLARSHDAGRAPARGEALGDRRPTARGRGLRAAA